MPKIVTKDIKIKDNGADHGKGSEPDCKAQSNRNPFPGQLSVEVWGCEANAGEKSNRSHREEVGVGD